MVLFNFKLLFGGLACGVLASIFAVIGLATTNWITLCFQSDSISQIASSSQNQPPPPPSFVDASDEDRLMCIRLGLFSRQDEVNGFVRVVSLRTDALETAVQATAVLLIMGVIAAVVSVVLMGVTTFQSMNRKSTRGPSLSPQCHGKLGLALGVAGTVCIGIAIFTYSIAQSGTVHNSVNFLSQTQNRLSGIVSKRILSNPDGNPADNQPTNPKPFNAFENILNIFSVSGITDPIRKLFSPGGGASEDACKSAEPPQQPDVAREATAIQALLDSWDPKFGYSFVLTWFAFFFSLAASILVAFAYRIKTKAPKQTNDSMLEAPAAQ